MKLTQFFKFRKPSRDFPADPADIDDLTYNWESADSVLNQHRGELARLDEEKATAAALELHKANQSNPHGVTKAQVGLGHAGDTSDMDKPVSTVQAAALAGKVDKAASMGLSANDYSAEEKAAVGADARGGRCGLL